jgi:hypothetical protein
MASKDQVNGSDYGTSKRLALMSSSEKKSYKATWVNTSTAEDSPIISINDYSVKKLSASKVVYRANSSTENVSLLTKSMSVYINQGPECGSGAANH